MAKFNAFVADQKDNQYCAEFRQLSLDELPEHDVLVDVAYSTVNYKDALAVTGKGKICRTFPMVCGIDLAGVVAESSSPQWKKGDRVIVNGYGLSETQWGGYSQRQRVSSEWLIALPDRFSLEQAMSIGTAGYTAMLCVNALRDHGLTPSDGPVVVTGASGGVGSISTLLLSKLGFDVTAVSGRSKMHDYLKSLGANSIIDRSELDKDARPLEKERWAAGIDSVGSRTLATLLSQTKYDGIVAACGLAGGFDLPSSVMPFILRGVTLRGIDSVMANQITRQRAWNDLERCLDIEKLNNTYKVEPISKLTEIANNLLNGSLCYGRVVIDVNDI